MPAEPPTVLRARLDALHAHAAVVLGRDVDGARWAQEAIEIAVQLDRPEVATDARTTLGVIERRAGDPAAAAAQFRSVADQAQAAGELGAELRSRYSLGALHYELGELPQALAAFRATADRAQQTGRRWAVLRHRGQGAGRAGAVRAGGLGRQPGHHRHRRPARRRWWPRRC